MGGDDGVVARLGDVFGLPVERLDEGAGIVDDHRFFVGHIEVRVAVEDVDAAFGEYLAGVGVLLLAVAPLGIEHDAHIDATTLRRDDCLEERGIGEEEHLDANGFFRACAMASRRGLAVSSGRTMMERDMGLLR